MIKLTFLVDDNHDSQNEEVKNEHGFSLFIEFEGKRFLCDTGSSELFTLNAEKFGIDLKNIHFSFISHGHCDHTGGLRYILDMNNAPVYLSDHIFNYKMFSYRHSPQKEIGIDQSLQKIYFNRFKFLSESTWITDKIAVIKNDSRSFDVPYSNSLLTIQKEETEVADDFRHELSLALDTPQGLIVISSCSHNGAMNILDSSLRFTGRKKIFAFVGGLHFIDGPHAANEANKFGEGMNKFFPGTTVYTGHCTGEMATKELSKYSNIKFFHTGSVLTF